MEKTELRSVHGMLWRLLKVDRKTRAHTVENTHFWQLRPEVGHPFSPFPLFIFSSLHLFISSSFHLFIFSSLHLFIS
jgi:hypothetical protein